MFINIIAAEFRDSEYSISEVQTLQDCGSSIPFMSQYGLPQDTSSGIHIKSSDNEGCRYTHKMLIVRNKVLWDLMNNY